MARPRRLAPWRARSGVEGVDGLPGHCRRRLARGGAYRSVLGQVEAVNVPIPSWTSIPSVPACSAQPRRYDILMHGLRFGGGARIPSCQQLGGFLGVNRLVRVAHWEKRQPPRQSGRGLVCDRSGHVSEVAEASRRHRRVVLPRPFQPVTLPPRRCTLRMPGHRSRSDGEGYKGEARRRNLGD